MSAALSVRATTSKPELPASRRWTMPGRSGLPDPGDVGEAGEQTVDEGAVGVAGTRMDDESSRLVDDDDRVVDVGDDELDRGVGLGRRGRVDRRRVDADAVADCEANLPGRRDVARRRTPHRRR